MYIIDTQQQQQRIKDMTVLRKNMETYEVFYHDPVTGQMWKSFFPRGFKKHKGPKLLRPEPIPENLEQQLEICLNSNDDGDAIGLGIECSIQPEKWEQILEVLDQNRKKYKRANLNTFIKHLGVQNPEDSLAEIQYSPDEAGLDQEKMKELKKKARNIKIKRFFRL